MLSVHENSTSGAPLSCKTTSLHYEGGQLLLKKKNKQTHKPEVLVGGERLNPGAVLLGMEMPQLLDNTIAGP